MSAEEIFARKRPSLPSEPIHIWSSDTFQQTLASSTRSWNHISLLTALAPSLDGAGYITRCQFDFLSASPL